MGKNHPVVMLDMDGVLADFAGGVPGAHGVDREAFFAAWPAGEWWGCLTALRTVTGRTGMTEAEFWGPINGNDGAYWERLDVLPGAAELVTVVKGLTDEWAFLTSPSECDYCVTGKVRWVRKHFGAAAARRVIPTPHKHYLARPGTVLIDDNETNCDRFTGRTPGVATGGAAIVYPAHHNALHPFKDDPLGHVLPLLEKLRD